MITWLIFLAIACIILWAYENKWTENDTQNFAQAARHGSRMRR